MSYCRWGQVPCAPSAFCCPGPGFPDPSRVATVWAVGPSLGPQRLAESLLPLLLLRGFSMVLIISLEAEIFLLFYSWEK